MTDFSEYDRKTEDELREILRSDAAGETALEPDAIWYITGLLSERRQKPAASAEQALEIFKREYAPQTAAKNAGRALRWRKWVAAAAAAAVILTGASLAARSFGVDLWQSVTDWTKETLHFQSGGETALASLPKALQDNGYPENLVPTWLPAGFEEKKIIVDNAAEKTLLFGMYDNGDASLCISVSACLHDSPLHPEQTHPAVEKYSVSGTDYYLFTDLGKQKAVWIRDGYECYISGNVEKDDLKQMIQSIDNVTEA